MNKHYSILHISDLHKGENNDFDHLFASLCNDADSYDQDIPKPEFIVVCGDLAEGANGEDAEEKIVKQYQEVESFLDKLVRHFLNGDKSRIIIVPGIMIYIGEQQSEVWKLYLTIYEKVLKRGI